MYHGRILQVFGLVLVASGTSWAQVTRRVSVDSSGGQSNGLSDYSAISSDGSLVAFRSYSTSLVGGDTNASTDVFCRGLMTSQTERASVNSSEVQGDGISRGPESVSADGRYVAFSSFATNLVPGDTNAKEDIFVRDRVTGTTQRVSVSSTAVQADGNSTDASISGDGRYVAFQSGATNLVNSDTNGYWDIFRASTQTGVIDRISYEPMFGLQGNGHSLFPAISADGNCIAFYSAATDLSAFTSDSNGVPDIYCRNMGAVSSDFVSCNTGGAIGDALSGHPSISADGNFVAFESSATNLVPGDTNGIQDIFVRDRLHGTTERVSVDSNGIQGNAKSAWPSISGDGRFVAFESEADNLVTGDTNTTLDIFLRDRDTTGFTSLCRPGLDGVIGCPCSNPPTNTGRGCNNSAGTTGALLTADGAAYLSADTLVFTTFGEKPTALSVLLQGDALASTGVVYGQGVRCVGGHLVRLFSRNASSGSVTLPNFAGGNPTVSARSAAKGDVIQPGEDRWYLVYYRDPVVLGGCPASRTFNATQTGRVSWSP
jgi:Tol biopolymer transport system component